MSAGTSTKKGGDRKEEKRFPAPSGRRENATPYALAVQLAGEGENRNSNLNDSILTKKGAFDRARNISTETAVKEEHVGASPSMRWGILISDVQDAARVGALAGFLLIQFSTFGKKYKKRNKGGKREKFRLFPIFARDQPHDAA